MKKYNIATARQVYFQMREAVVRETGYIDENQEAILFVKALQIQGAQNPRSVRFGADQDFYVSVSPAGYAVTGYYDEFTPSGGARRQTFNVTVAKVNGLWQPSAKYVGSDTKAGSSFVLTWVLLMVGCSLFGLLMYFIMSAAIGF